VAGEFARSNHDFKVLLRHVLSSPMVTYRTRTKTWNDSGANAGVALRDDLCRRLQNRFGIQDACGVRGELNAPPALRTAGGLDRESHEPFRRNHRRPQQRRLTTVCRGATV